MASSSDWPRVKAPGLAIAKHNKPADLPRDIALGQPDSRTAQASATSVHVLGATSGIDRVTLEPTSITQFFVLAMAAVELYHVNSR